jgi:outer membrane protein, heavy metal efflux system
MLAISARSWRLVCSPTCQNTAIVSARITALRIVVAGAAGLLAACASIPADQGRGVSERLRQAHSVVTTGKDVKSLLAQPLDADGCVQVALLASPRLQKLYAELGVAQADVYEATRIANPSLSYTELRNGGSEVRKTLGLSQRITELLFLRASTRVAKSALLQTQQRIAAAVLEQEAQVRKAYYDYVAAALADQLRQRMAAVAAASAQYAEELHAAGNINELELSRERIAASEARVLQLQSQLPQARAGLLKLMGVTGEAQFVERLVLPAPASLDAAPLQSFAMQQRLDLAAAREELGSAEAQLQLTHRWRWVGGVDVGVEREREVDGVVAKGPSAGVELPVFNQGGDKQLRAAARVTALTADIRALELDIHHDVAAQVALLAAAAAAVDEYRQRLMPAQARVVALSRQQQNFMLSGAFDVLQARQQQLAGWQAYLQAVADYWKIRSELARVAGGRLPEGVAPSAAPAEAALPAEGE